MMLDRTLIVWLLEWLFPHASLAVQVRVTEPPQSFVVLLMVAVRLYPTLAE